MIKTRMSAKMHLAIKHLTHLAVGNC